ncbi:hypothetical protein T484DRAFT_1968996 [Baffinella frigidus]|nr:hypothetical protein T484DRAFT_1968996 [Cryptophyta sp. CCMP2293]
MSEVPLYSPDTLRSDGHEKYETMTTLYQQSQLSALFIVFVWPTDLDTALLVGRRERACRRFRERGRPGHHPLSRHLLDVRERLLERRERRVRVRLVRGGALPCSACGAERRHAHIGRLASLSSKQRPMQPPCPPLARQRVPRRPLGGEHRPLLPRVRPLPRCRFRLYRGLRRCYHPRLLFGALLRALLPRSRPPRLSCLLLLPCARLRRLLLRAGFPLESLGRCAPRLHEARLRPLERLHRVAHSHAQPQRCVPRRAAEAAHPRRCRTAPAACAALPLQRCGCHRA